MAKIFQKTSPANEKVLILGVREAFYQPFLATNWTDLRVGFFLSICGNTDPGEDDTITGLSEEIGTPPRPFLPWEDRFSLGVTDSHTGRIFLGYTNVFGERYLSIGTSKVVSSDSAIGTTNTNFWRVKNEMSDNATIKIIDNFTFRGGAGTDGSQLHLVQDTTGAGGYATLVALRLQRDDALGRARVITMSVKSTGVSHNGDILYTNTPNETVLQENLEDFPDTVQQLGPVELPQVPDTIWAYWPFRNSRLRIHAHGILRASAA